MLEVRRGNSCQSDIDLVCPVSTIAEVIVASHQPSYLPWSGFFQKALNSDVFVLLDSVQFPRGQSWVNRNRIKGPSGTIWLTVPVKKKGRGLQLVREVEVYHGRDWSRRHCLTLSHMYGNAPYFGEHFPFFKEVYSREWKSLVDLNLMILDYLRTVLGVGAEFTRCSTLGAEGRGTQLLVNVCERLGCHTYLASHGVRKYLNVQEFTARGMTVHFRNFAPPVYPQLWGEFVSNLSVLDLIFNCGGKSLDILKKFSF